LGAFLTDGILFFETEYLWFPYWNYATTQSFFQLGATQINCSPANEYTIFLFGCFNTGIQFPVPPSPPLTPPETYAIWPGVGPHVAGQISSPTLPISVTGGTGCGGVLLNAAPNQKIVLGLSQCSSVAAFAYVPPTVTTIQPVHYSASFYPMRVTFGPTGTFNNTNFRNTQLTFQWSASPDWIQNYLTTPNPVNPGMTDLFENIFGPGITGFTGPDGTIINSARCVPLLIGANEARSK
jgi:hypothetical protein